MIKSEIRTHFRKALEDLNLSFLVTAFRRVKFAYFRTKRPEQFFEEIYQRNAWNGVESVSGTGSDLCETKVIRETLPKILKQYGIKSILDAPCGDFHWMKYAAMENVDYTGVEIVPDLIRKLATRYSGEHRKFRLMNIIQDPLPKADLIFCRDALVHFPYREISQTVANFKRSGATYLLTTTFPGHANRDVAYMSLWRPVDFQGPPFRWPTPLLLLNEQCPEQGYADKSLALWRVSDLPD